MNNERSKDDGAILKAPEAIELASESHDHLDAATFAELSNIMTQINSGDARLVVGEEIPAFYEEILKEIAMTTVMLAFKRAKNVTADAARSAVGEAVKSVDSSAEAKMHAKQILGPRSGMVAVTAPMDQIPAIIDAVEAAPEIVRVKPLQPAVAVRATLDFV